MQSKAEVNGCQLVLHQWGHHDDRLPAEPGSHNGVAGRRLQHAHSKVQEQHRSAQPCELITESNAVHHSQHGGELKGHSKLLCHCSLSDHC
jgi:hypothetical protein